MIRTVIFGVGEVLRITGRMNGVRSLTNELHAVGVLLQVSSDSTNIAQGHVVTLAISDCRTTMKSSHNPWIDYQSTSRYDASS